MAFVCHPRQSAKAVDMMSFGIAWRYIAEGKVPVALSSHLKLYSEGTQVQKDGLLKGSLTNLASTAVSHKMCFQTVVVGPTGPNRACKACKTPVSSLLPM